NKKHLEEETHNLLIYCLHFAINQFNIIGYLFYTCFLLRYSKLTSGTSIRYCNKKKRDFLFTDIINVFNELSEDKGKARESKTISQPGNKELPSDSGNCFSLDKARIRESADETEVLN